MNKISVNGTEINVVSHNNSDYICITDVLNVALFGKTAKEWRDDNPNKKGNLRDYASMNELICLSNLENINAMLINENLAQSKRLEKLNQIAIHQMTVLQEVDAKKLLK